MKKFLSILLVLTMVLSLGVTALADENTGSITITNATIGNAYSLYKIFDATYSTDASGNADAVSYSITADNQFFSYMFGADGKTENTYFSYDAVTGAVARKEGTQKGDIIGYLTDMVRAMVLSLPSTAIRLMFRLSIRTRFPALISASRFGMKKPGSGLPTPLLTSAIWLTSRLSLMLPTMTARSRSSTIPLPIPRAMHFG